MKTITAAIQAPNAKIAIAVGRFNQFINDSLLAGAIDGLTRIGLVAEKNITVVWVPGAYELPLTAKMLAKTKHYDAIIALGSIIRGSTTHFDYVAGPCSAGLASVAQEQELPVIFGVLTTDTIEQAIERAGTKAGNKGFDAALTALEMVNILAEIKQ